MRILGIESSCDETALAVVTKRDGRLMVEQNVLASQVAVHARTGGVVPEVAAREHIAHIFPLLEQIGVERSGAGIDAVAVTCGPGLVPALRVGVELGKSLSWTWGKPLVPVNHLEGHIYSVWLAEKTPVFPALCLLVSGGHTELVLMRNHGVYELLGMTRDDAAGEAFDKVAKLLGLPYPGGPEIARLALEGDPTAIHFPRPMMDSPNLDFSFSGLKTAVKVAWEGRAERAEIAASFQQAVVDTLVGKTLRAVGMTHPKCLILTGGVSANRLLRTTLERALQQADMKISFFAPELSLTGDNAVMIALAGAFRFEAGHMTDPLTLVADANLRLT
ncbi:tRNA (adenosine(37)-N6)-threonylcarbamoyltransferase complex transferase subunit TsaD [Candidatus Uhrbacteria bacterium]|nr:tRNA (adenosine(37)-N6)-threonylcarbamoyltransferase complex transferase subunit TsaD [Candidatus Uhrbacteria bacterium]